MDYRGHNITHWDNIKTLGVKFRKSLGNNKYSAFPPGLTKLCNMLWLGRKFKLFSEGGGCFYRPDFYWGTKTGCNCRRCLTRFWIRFFNKQHYITIVILIWKIVHKNDVMAVSSNYLLHLPLLYESFNYCSNCVHMKTSIME